MQQAAWLGHQKWFISPDEAGSAALRSMETAGLVGAAVAVSAALAAYGIWRARGRCEFVPGPTELGAIDHRRAVFYALVPALLALHVAVPLIVNPMRGVLFSPDNPLTGPPRYLLGVAQLAVALAFLYGALVRPAALLLAAVWAVGVWLRGPVAMGENLHYLGYALFFFYAGRGPIAVDRLLFPRLEPRAALADRALPVLRVSIGAGLCLVAFTEKLANPALALAFLDRYPLNFTDDIGIPMSDATFAVCAGSIELFVGLMLILGCFPRLVILIAWLPFNLTLCVFNWVELVGHLPIYGAIAVLLVWTPGEADRRLWREGVQRLLLPAAER